MPWSLYTVFCAAATAYVFVPVVLNSLLVLLMPTLPVGPRNLATELATLVCWAIVFYLLYRTCQKQGNCSLREILGLTHEKPWAYYVLESLIAMLIASTLVYAISAFKQTTGLDVPKGIEDISADELSALAIVSVGIAPILEEFVFRGYLQTALTQYFKSPFWAIIVGSLIFLLCHNLYLGSIVAMLYVFCLGLLLGYFRWRTGSIIPCIVAHLANNSVAMQGMLNSFFGK